MLLLYFYSSFYKTNSYVVNNKISSQSFDVQLDFIGKLKKYIDNIDLSSFSDCLFNSVENGVFLKLYLPNFIRNYSVETTFLDFFRIFKYRRHIINVFYYIKTIDI